MEITIILANYNGGEHLAEALASLKNQSHKKWRLVIFDDGSTDNSLQTAQAFVDAIPNTQLLRHQDGVNKGLPQTLQEALARVETPWVAFLEHDDIWHEDYLKEKLALIKKYPQAGIIYNPAEPFGTLARVKKLSLYYKAVNFYTKLLNPFTKAYVLNFALMGFNPVPAFSCVMAKTDTIKAADFNAPFAPWLDWWVWAQLSFKNKFYYLDKKLTRWRLHDKSYTVQTLREAGQKHKHFKTALFGLYKNNMPAAKFYTYRCLTAVGAFALGLALAPVKLCRRHKNLL